MKHRVHIRHTLHLFQQHWCKFETEIEVENIKTSVLTSKNAYTSHP